MRARYSTIALGLLVAMHCCVASAKERKTVGAEVVQFEASRLVEYLALDPQGKYVAVSGGGGWVDIWPLRPGASPVTFRATKGNAGAALVVLLGSPCMAVAGAEVNPFDEPRTLVVASCETGEVVARIKSAPKRASAIMNLVALPSCGKVAALYGKTVALLDIERRTVLAIDREIKAIAVAALQDDCRLYGTAKPEKDPKNSRVMGDLTEVDLRAQRRRSLGPILDRAPVQKPFSGKLGWLAVSPQRRRVALSLENLSQIDARRKGDGTTELQVVDVKSRSVDRNSWQEMKGDVLSFEYLDEDRLLVETLEGFYVFDIRTKRLTSLQAELSGAESPRMMSAAPGPRLLAIGYERKVRVHKVE